MSKQAPADRPPIAAVIVQDGRMLIVRRHVAEASLLWQFPAGEVEPGETFEDAVVREMQEETGVTVAARRVFGADQPGDMPGDERSIAARAPHAECGRTVRQCCSYHPRETPVVMLAHEFCERHSCCKRLYSRDQLSQPIPSPSRSKP